MGSTGPTVARCEFQIFLLKSQAQDRIGEVTMERRRIIRQKIIAILGS